MPQKDFYQISLKIILKNDKDEILILKAIPDGTYSGFYDLPGGRIDEDEFSLPFNQIIQREINEEIGDIQIVLDQKPVGIGRHVIPAAMTSENKDIHVLYIFFEAQLVSGDINISDEHIGFRWINLKEHDPAKLFKSGILEGINMYLQKDSNYNF